MKNTFRIYLLSLAIAGIATSGPALADATLKITGTIRASPCEVDSSDLNNTVTVNLGNNIEAVKLATAGSATDWVLVTLSLKNCPDTTTNAIASFIGTAATETGVTDMYENTGTATNVQIELQDKESGERKGNGSTMEAAVSANAASFPLRARAYTAQGGVRPGNIEGSVQVAFTYQ